MSIWAQSGTKQYQTSQICVTFPGGHKLSPQRCCCSEATEMRLWGSLSSSAPREVTDSHCAAPLTGPALGVALPPGVTPPSSPAAAQRNFVVQVTTLVYYGLWALCRKDPRHLQKQLKSVRSSVRCSASETPYSYTDTHCHPHQHQLSARSSASTILEEMLIPSRSATLVSYPNCSKGRENLNTNIW